MTDVQGTIANAVAAEALSWLGTAYRHQGSRKGVGCDCIGLVLGVWRAIHGEPPELPGPYAPDWAEAGGAERFLAGLRRHLQEKPKDAMVAGDVLLFRWRPHLPAKHAGILTGPACFVHAYEGSAVVQSPLGSQWLRRIAGVFAFPDTPSNQIG